MDVEKKFSLLRFVALVPILLGPAGLHAHDAQAELAAEATVYEDQTDNNSGGLSEVCIGNLVMDTRRAFVRYTLPEIQAGSTINRVVWTILQDRVRDPGPGPLAATLQVRRALDAWDEGTGSGGVMGGPCGGGENVPGVDWATQPDVAGTDSATAALPAENTAVDVVIDTNTGHDGLLADVQAWVDGASNFGWRLAVVEEGTADNARVLVPGTMTIYWTVPVGGLPFADGFETP